MTPDGALLAVLNFEEATISVINLSTKQVQATYPLLMQADVDCGGQPLDISPVKPHKMLLNVQCTGTLDGGTFRIIDQYWKLQLHRVICVCIRRCDRKLEYYSGSDGFYFRWE